MAQPIRIFCDGACSGNGSDNAHTGIGVVVEWQGKAPLIVSKYTGHGTNNTAEYNGLLEALNIIKDENIKLAKIHSDSNLIVNQVNGNWKCKDSTLKQLLFKTQKRIEWLKEKGFKIALIYIPRELNVADGPAKEGSKNR